MHISEIGFCSGHSASGVFVDEFARTTVPGLYAAGDMASVPHNYMLGAFTNGSVAGEDAADYAANVDHAAYDEIEVAREKERVLAPTRREDGIPPNQIEYKARRLVNDYLQPPKVTRKYEIGAAPLRRGARGHDGADDRPQRPRADALARGRLDHRLRRHGGVLLAVPHREPLGALSPAHGLSGKGRRELVLPHAARKKDGRMVCEKRAVDPYIVPIADEEKGLYDKQRIRATALTSEAEGFTMPLATTSTSVPVVVDDAKCIADKGCTVCVDVCPLDVLRISDATGKAYMAYDECWYCMPCEADCPTGAVTVTIPYLLK